MKVLDKQITIHQSKIREISKNITNEKQTDKIIILSSDINNEDIILETLLNIDFKQQKIILSINDLDINDNEQQPQINEESYKDNDEDSEIEILLNTNDEFI